MTVTQRIYYEYPLRRDPWFWAQVIVPRNMTTKEADRLCAFIMTLSQPKTQPQEGKG